MCQPLLYIIKAMIFVFVFVKLLDSCLLANNANKDRKQDTDFYSKDLAGKNHGLYEDSL